MAGGTASQAAVEVMKILEDSELTNAGIAGHATWLVLLHPSPSYDAFNQSV